ncbi:MAG: 4-hydroxy-tetrahydrodipicolinate synthase [Planctomycetes bacterium]|nr:4-hydroxy-tetrahydrodipicolinate synthase [Planctomycetota bacterium]
MFSGCITALVTPFKQGKVDYSKLFRLIDAQIKAGVQGLVLAGTTGEGATLTDQEKEKLFRTAVRYIKSQIIIIAGTGSNDTVKTIKLTRMAKSAGVDGALIVTPYYNKPTQAGLYLHYKTVAGKVGIPIIVYNVPGRTGVSIAPETVARLAGIRNIVAIKEASGSLEQVTQIKALCDIPILSGEDYLTFPILCLGGKGVISVTSNIAPEDVAAMVRAWEGGNIDLARDYHYKLAPLNKTLFIESNPIPVKTALKMMGMLNGELRLPLCPMAKENIGKLKTVLKTYGLSIKDA